MTKISLSPTKVEDAIPQQSSKSKVEGMACLLLLGKAANFCAAKVPVDGGWIGDSERTIVERLYLSEAL